MSVQPNVNVGLAYKVETTFGVAPAASGAQYLRRVSSTLGPVKDTFESQEVRQDLQVYDMRHGMRQARGNISGELSTATYDDLLEAALRGTWAAGVSVAPADFATGVTVATPGTTSTLTFAGAGNLITKGFKVGDIVRTTGFTNPANNSTTCGNLRIVALTSTVMTVYPAITAAAQQAAGWSVAVPGKKLQFGTTKRSFTFEHNMNDALVFDRYSGVRVNGFRLGAAPNGMSNIDFELIGQSFTIGTATQYFTTPTAETTTGLLSAVDGFIRLNGEEQGVVTQLQLDFTNNCSNAPVIGTNISPEIYYGRMKMSGSVTAYLEDADLINVFVNESEVDLVATLEASGAAPQDFLSFSIQRLKFQTPSRTIGAEGGVVATFPFQALLKPGGTGTVYDQTTMVINRSN